MATGSGVTNLVAAQLSDAAYVPLSTYQSGGNFQVTGLSANTLPNGWQVDVANSYATADGSNQFITLVNPTTQQVMVTFKGSDSASNFESDLANSGGSAWESLAPAVSSAIANIQSEYPGYQIMTDGHSLGGGMSQTADLEYGLSGYGQNSLPISTTALGDSAITNQGGQSAALSSWQSTGNTFTEVNNAGDPATLYYSTLQGQLYLNTDASTTTLSNPYAAGEVGGLAVGGLLGDIFAAYNAYQAHSLPNVINELSSQQGATGDNSAVNASAATDDATIASNIGSYTSTLNADGSMTLTSSSGTQITCELVSSATDEDIYGITSDSQTSENFSVITGGSGNTYTGASGIPSIFSDLSAGSNSIGLTQSGSQVYASNDSVSLGLGVTASATGSDDNFTLVNGGDNALVISGADEDVNSVGNTITLDGSQSSAAITGVNTVNMDGASQQLTLNTSGCTVDAIAGDTSEAINGSGFTLNAASGQFTGLLTGNSDTADVAADSTVGFVGTGETANLVNNSSSTANFGVDSTGTVNGSGDTVDICGTGATVDTSDNTFNFLSGGYTTVIVGNSDTANVASDSTTVFQGTGEVADLGNDDGSTVNFRADSTGTVDGTGDAIGITGSGDTVTASDDAFDFSGSGDTTVIIGNGDAANISSDSLTAFQGTGEVANLGNDDGSTVNFRADSSGTVNGSGDTVGITGSGDTVTASSDTFNFSSNGDDTQIDGNGNTINVAADSSTGLDGTNNALNLASDDGSTVNFDASSSGTVNGSDDTIGICGGGDIVNASNDTFNFNAGGYLTAINGSADTVNAASDSTTSLTGSNEIVNLAADDGSTVNFGANSGGNVNGSGDTIGICGNDDVVNASNDTFNFNAVGYLSAVNGSGDTVNAASDSTTSLAGSNNVANLASNDGSTVNFGADSSGTVNGSGDAIGVCGNDDTVHASNDTFNFNAGGYDTNVDGNGDTINVASNALVGINGTSDIANLGSDDGSTIDFGGSSSGTVNGSGDTIGICGTGDDVTASNDTFNFSSADDNTQINGNTNTVNVAEDSTTGFDGSGDVFNLVNNGDITVNFGADSSATLKGTGDTAGLCGDDDDVTLSNSGDTVDLVGGMKGDTIDGSGDTIYGSNDQISLSGQDDSIDLSHATIDIAGDDHATIDGSDDVIVGGSGDDFTITGTDDDVSATDSTVNVDGSNTGDYVSGSGDSGSNWDDPDGGDPDPGSGYYGYGLTKWKNKNPSAAEIAKAEQSDSVYEGAKWADKTITWSFASASGGISDAITNTKEQQAVEQAFQAWAKASGVNFDEVAAGSSADIEVGFGDLNLASSNQIGLTKYTRQGGTLTSAQVELEDPNQASLTTNAAGQLAYANTNATFEQVALHEIGHALGLADNDVAGSIMNAVLGTSNQSLNGTDTANIQGLYAKSSYDANPTLTQANQLVQAMSTFDVEGIAMNELTPALDNAYLYQEHLQAGAHNYTHVA
jgi:predicted Zn-dependent protease